MFTSPQAVHPRTWKALLIILGCALVLHCVSDIGVYKFRRESISTTPDPLDYRLAALNILHYGQFTFAPPALHAPQLLRTPVYPFLLAGTYFFDGESGLGIILLQSLMLIAMSWMLFRLLLVFRIPDTLTLVLVTLYLFEPFQWLYTLHTMTETLASFLVLALITAALVGTGIHNLARAALYGVGLGITVLEKPSVMMWVPFLLLLILCASGDWRVRFVRGGVAILFFLATLSPWVIRNYELTGFPIVDSASAYGLIEFAGTPGTATWPSSFRDVVMMANYNGHTNEVWYAYTTNAYASLLAADHAIMAQANYWSLITRQIVCAPTVWFGDLQTKDQEEYGHEYGLIANFVLPPNTTRYVILSAVDTILWSSVLFLTILGSILLVRNSSLRWQFLPLLGMLLATLFVNLCAAWVRMLLPMYPVIIIATGIGIDFLIRHARLLKNV